MRRRRAALLGIILLLTVGLLAACGADPAPSAPIDESPFRPLPPVLAGLLAPAAPVALLQPSSTRGLPAGPVFEYELGHCGVGSPIDFDGSLWDPLAGHDGAGGRLTDQHLGELINATRLTVVLVDPNVATMATPAGAVILLQRHAGARAYPLCD